MIEVRYAGVVVGRSAIIRELDTRGLFLGLSEPLPVGTPVFLKVGDRPGAEAVPGKVEVVSESHEVALAGMRIRFSDPGAASLFGTPAEAGPDQAPSAGPVTTPEATAPNTLAAVEPIEGDEGLSAAPEQNDNIPVPDQSGRIPAPDPSAFAASAGGKKNRRNRRR